MTTYQQNSSSGHHSHHHHSHHGNHHHHGNAGGAESGKKEEFRRYLEKSGVLDALVKVLVGLYEEPDRPSNALGYVQRYLGAPTGVDVEGLKRQNDALQRQVEQLQRQLQEATQQPAPSAGDSSAASSKQG